MVKARGLGGEFRGLLLAHREELYTLNELIAKGSDKVDVRGFAGTSVISAHSK